MYQSTYENDFPGNGIALSAGTIGDRIHSLLRMLLTRRQRSEGRRQLSHLSHRLLEDAGISRQQLYEEIGKPSWRA